MNVKNEKNPQPTVDLGYPTPAQGVFQCFRASRKKPNSGIPIAFSIFPSEFEYVGFEEPRSKKDAPISIRLDHADRARLKAEADRMGIGPSTIGPYLDQGTPRRVGLWM